MSDWFFLIVGVAAIVALLLSARWYWENWS